MPCARVPILAAFCGTLAKLLNALVICDSELAVLFNETVFIPPNFVIFLASLVKSAVPTFFIACIAVANLLTPFASPDNDVPLILFNVPDSFPSLVIILSRALFALVAVACIFISNESNSTPCTCLFIKK